MGSLDWECAEPGLGHRVGHRLKVLVLSLVGSLPSSFPPCFPRGDRLGQARDMGKRVFLPVCRP